MKKLLALSYAFPPQLNPESILVAKLLAGLSKQKQCTTIVFCADEKTSTEAIDPTLASILPKGLCIEKLPTGERTILRRFLFLTFPFLQKFPDKSVWWVLKNRGSIVSLCKRHNPDILYSHSHYLGSHLLALKVKQKTGLPWVAHFSDPWCGNPYAKYGPLTTLVNRRWERAVIRHADSIIFVSAPLRDFVMRHYPKSWRKKCTIVPHPYDPELYPRKHKRKKSSVTFSYIGNFYGRRIPTPFLKALSIIKAKHPEIYQQLRVQFVGYLSEKWKRHPLFLEHHVQIIHVPHVPYLKSLEYMQVSDVLVLIDADMEQAVFLPSKLIDYLGTGKPILGITPLHSPAAALLHTIHNPVIAPSDIATIAAACIRLFHAVQHHTNAFRYQEKEIRQYHTDTVAKSVGDIFTSFL